MGRGNRANHVIHGVVEHTRDLTHEQKRDHNHENREQFILHDSPPYSITLVMPTCSSVGWRALPADVGESEVPAVEYDIVVVDEADNVAGRA